MNLMLGTSFDGNIMVCNRHCSRKLCKPEHCQHSVLKQAHTDLSNAQWPHLSGEPVFVQMWRSVLTSKTALLCAARLAATWSLMSRHLRVSRAAP